MLLVFISIPLMILAVAIATVPIIVAMRQEAVEQRRALGNAVEIPPFAAAEQRRAA